jgi:hypothetical protein
MPDLVRYQLRDGPHGQASTHQRGKIERLARECLAAECQPCLDRTVVETRFTVVRSSVPAVVQTVRRLRDFLPPVDRVGLTPQAKQPLRDVESAVPAA